MADYRSILDRAINGLSNNTEEARRAIYEKARSALMRQLSSLEPALSPAEISKQRLQLEEAVRETENQFTGIGALEDAVAGALEEEPITPEPAAPAQIEATPAPVMEAVPEPEPEPLPAPEPEPIPEPEPVVAAPPPPTPVIEEAPEPVLEAEPVIEEAPIDAPISTPDPMPMSPPDLPTVGEKSDVTPLPSDVTAVVQEANIVPEEPDLEPEPVEIDPPIEPEVDVEPKAPTVDDIVRSAEAEAVKLPKAPELPPASDLIIDEPKVETPEISVATPEPTVDVASLEVDAPKVPEPSVAALAPSLPEIKEPTLETPKGAKEKVGFPAVDTPDVSVSPSVDNPNWDDPLEDLRSTMADDGVDVEPAPTPEINFTEPDNVYDTFEDPSLANFDPEPVTIPPAKKRGKGLVGVLILLLLVGAGVFAFVQREALVPLAGPVIEQVRGMIGLDAPSSTPSSPTETPVAAPSEEDDGKAEDRLPSKATDSDAGITPGERVALPDTDTETTPEEPVRDLLTSEPEEKPEEPAVTEVPAETPTTAAPETPAEAEKPADQPLFTPPAATEETPSTETAAAEEKPETPTASSLFSANAILYEENVGGNQPTISTGNVLWELIEGGGSSFGASNLPSVRGNLRIQGRDLEVRFEIIRNLDDSLPASHVIELEFKPGPLFQEEVVNNIAGVVTKKNEQDNGKLLAGAVVKVSDTLFWVAMSARAADLASNTDALLKNGWFDIPIVFKSGKRAILTLEKGAAGQKALETAFKAWNQ